MNIYLLADPGDTGGMVQYCKDQKILWRPDPKVPMICNLMEFAGRICYDAFEYEDGFHNENLTKIREGNDVYMRNIIKSGHTSVLEHGNIVFLFSGVSRVFTHELCRHRVGTAFSQTSGRYVRSDFDMYMPDCIKENKEAVKVWNAAIYEIKELYNELENCFDFEDEPFSYKKEVTSALRRILPNGMGNNLVFSCNHRELRHIINLRTSEGAEEEIRKVFTVVKDLMLERFPNLYEDIE